MGLSKIWWEYTKYSSFDIRNRLFTCFCLSLYGCVLWDYSSKHIELIYVAWRKCMRRLLDVSPKTHCDLLPYICDDIPISGQVHKRVLNCYHGLLMSANLCIKIYASLALHGSNSSLCNILNFICCKYNICKYYIVLNSQANSVHFYHGILENEGKVIEEGVIKYVFYMVHTCTGSGRENIQSIVDCLCTC